MNLQDLIKKQTKVREIEVNHKGENIQFYIKPLNAGDQEKLLEQFGDTLPIIKKYQEAEASGVKIPSVTGKEFVMMQTAKRKHAACVLSDADGKKLFPNYAKMLASMDSELLDIIADKIEEETKDEKETAEQIEKN